VLNEYVLYVIKGITVPEPAWGDTVPTNSNVKHKHNAYTITAMEININIQQNIHSEWLYKTFTPLHHYSAAVMVPTVYVPLHIIIFICKCIHHD